MYDAILPLETEPLASQVGIG